jgi:hypothetical protein
MNRKFSRRAVLKPLAALPLGALLTALFPSPWARAKSAIPSEVRSITPPKLDAVHLGKRTLCYRPMRKGSPNMGLEQRDKQTIAYNYGHGGSGWTLAPGSASYVIDLAEKSFQPSAIDKGQPMVVIGAGAMGLFTAYELVQRGYSNITVISEKFEGLTSHNAGGLLAPVSMDNNPAMQVIIDKIGIQAYRFYSAVANGRNPELGGGATIVPAYFERRSDSGLEPYVGIVMQPAKDVVLDFGNGTSRPMVAYDDGIFIDTAVLMDKLRRYLEPHVRFEQRKVDKFSDLQTNLIFNCSGLGAAELNADSKLVSVQGHLIMLKDQNPKDLQSMILIYLDSGKTASGQNVKRSFYIFPKHLPDTAANDVGVIGGTFIEGATAATPNIEEFDRIIAGAKKFYGT